MIINDYLHNFQEENIIKLISIVAKFAGYRGVNNISFAAVGMFWNISDFISKTLQKTVSIICLLS